MVDQPGRSAPEPEHRASSSDRTEAVDEAGWGSPLPAEYGSLQAERPPQRGTETAPLSGGLVPSWARSRTGAGGPTGAGSELAATGLAGAGAGGGGAATGMTGPGLAAPESTYHQPEPLPPRPVPAPRPGRRPARTSSRVVIRHIDVASVAKVAVVFWLVVLVVIVVAAVLLWVAADSFGTLPSIDKSLRSLFSLRKFELHAGAVAMYSAAAGLLMAIIGTLASILLAAIYNLIADMVGGIRVQLETFGRE